MRNHHFEKLVFTFLVAICLTVSWSAQAATPRVSTAGCHTVAVKSDGTVWAWGRNSNDQLGDGTTILQ